MNMYCLTNFSYTRPKISWIYMFSLIANLCRLKIKTVETKFVTVLVMRIYFIIFIVNIFHASLNQILSKLLFSCKWISIYRTLHLKNQLISLPDILKMFESFLNSTAKRSTCYISQLQKQPINHWYILCGIHKFPIKSGSNQLIFHYAATFFYNKNFWTDY